MIRNLEKIHFENLHLGYLYLYYWRRSIRGEKAGYIHGIQRAGNGSNSSGLKFWS